MDANEHIVERLKQWMEDKGISSPSEYGANTPMYIYRMWGGEVPLKEIEKALGEVIVQFRVENLNIRKYSV